MIYLITGAGGYVGRYLCDELKRKKMIFKAPSRYELNLSDYKEVCDYIKTNNISNIIHLAARIGTDNLADMFESNIHALYIVLRAAISEQIRHFTFVSTNNIYGTGYNRPIAESDPCIPHFNNDYAISKYLGELMVEDQMGRSGVGYAVARLADVYGPGQKEGKLIKRVVQNIRDNVPQRIYGSGKRRRDYIYVEDVAKALIYVSEHNLEGVYNVSTGIGTSVCEIVEYAEHIVECGVEKIQVEEGKEDETCIILDNSKLSHKGYLSTISIDEGLKKIIDKAYLTAAELLKTHIDKLHTVAGILLEKEKIDGEEFDSIFAE